MAGVFGAIFGMAGRNAERAGIRAAAATAASRAAEEARAGMVRDSPMMVGTPASTHYATLCEQARSGQLMDGSGAPLDPLAVSDLYENTLHPLVDPFRREAEMAAHVSATAKGKIGSSEYVAEYRTALANALQPHQEKGVEAGQKAIAELASRSFGVEVLDPDGPVAGKPLFTRNKDGSVAPASDEQAYRWQREVREAEAAARKAELAKGEALAAEVRAWDHGAPKPVKVGLPLAAAGGLTWGTTELLSDD